MLTSTYTCRKPSIDFKIKPGDVETVHYQEIAKVPLRSEQHLYRNRLRCSRAGCRGAAMAGVRSTRGGDGCRIVATGSIPASVASSVGVETRAENLPAALSEYHPVTNLTIWLRCSEVHNKMFIIFIILTVYLIMLCHG